MPMPFAVVEICAAYALKKGDAKAFWKERAQKLPLCLPFRVPAWPFIAGELWFCTAFLMRPLL
jgi:hypothetical protein